MSDKDNFEDIIKRIQNKLDKNPELQDEIEKHILAIQEIFEHPIEVNLIYGDEIFDDYDEDGELFEDLENVDLSKSMTINEFIDFLSKEKEGNLKIAIDPIYLKKGINEITNVLITTYDDKAIIVPANRKEDE